MSQNAPPHSTPPTSKSVVEVEGDPERSLLEGEAHLKPSAELSDAPATQQATLAPLTLRPYATSAQVEGDISLVLHVECYAGYKADERPLRFAPQAPGAKTREVVEILDQWYGPGYLCFKVRADDHNLYILRHEERTDLWTLEAFRRREK